MPTPRPLTSVTCSAVEKPGSKIRLQTSWSLSLASAATSPRSTALRKIRSRSRPRPSSLISITIMPAWCDAFSRIRPAGGLPLASRSAGVSMPWSMLLRSMCTSGSCSSSTIVRSSSTSSP